MILFLIRQLLVLPLDKFCRDDSNDAEELLSSPSYMATATANRVTSPRGLEKTAVESEATLYLNEFKFYHDAVPPRTLGEVSYLLGRPSPEPELHLVPRSEQAGNYRRYCTVPHTSPRSVILRDDPLHLGRPQFTGNTEGLRYPSRRNGRPVGVPLLKAFSSVSDDEPSSAIQSLFP